MSTMESDLQVKGDLSVLKRKSTRGAVATFISQGLKILISFGSQIILARLITPTQFGLVAMVSPLLGFVAIFSNLGLHQATVQRKDITQSELSATFWIIFSMSVAFALILVIVSPAAAWFYGEPKVMALTIALALLLPVSGLGSQSYALMNRRMQFVTLAKIDIATTAIGAAGGIAAALLGAGYWSLVVVQIFSSFSSTIIVWVMSGWRPSRPRWDTGALSMLKFGGHVVAFNIVSYFSSYIDNIMIGVTRGPMVLGLFDRAFRLILQPLGQMTAPVSRIAVPMLSHLNGDDALYRKAYLRMLQLVLVSTIPGLVCASVMANEVVAALLGPMWAGTAPIMQWLSIAGMFAAYSLSTYWLFISQNRPKEQMHCGFISSALIMLSFLVGLPWGPVGIAMSYAAFAPLVHGCFVWIATRTGPIRRRDVLSGSYPMILAALVSAASLHKLKAYLPFNIFFNVVAGAGISYALVMLTLICIPDGRRMLRNLWVLRKNLSAT